MISGIKSKISFYFFGRLKAIHESLVEKGVGEDIVKLVHKYGKPNAIELCTNLTQKGELCTDIINLLFIYIK